MKTTIVTRSGNTIEAPGRAPTIDPEGRTVGLMDDECGTDERELGCEDVERVVFEPNA